jgi:hypothetical protein
MRKILAAALAVVTMTAAGAAPAAADDAALKHAWEDGPACDLEAKFERFERAIDDLELKGLSPQETRRALVAPDRAARSFETSLGRCADVLERRQTSSPDGAAAQRLLVDGVRTVGDGIGAYRDSVELLGDVTRARSPAEARRLGREAHATLRRCARLMRRGGMRGDRAEKILRRL